MFSEESIGWYATDNFVKDRMIDNSLMHKFASSKILKRTKTLNVKIKKYGVIDYKHYVKLKTNIIRSMVEDTDNDISDILSDTDYSVICRSLIKNEDSVDDSKTYISTEEDVKKPTNTKSKGKINSEKGSIPKKKLSHAKCDTSVSKKRINISWQKVTKKNKDISHLSNNQSCINNKEDTFKNNNDYLNARVDDQSLSQQFDSQNSTSSMTKSISKNMNESFIDSSTMISEFSSSQDSAIFKITSDESEIENYKEQNAGTSKSSTELDSQNAPDSSSKYQASSLKSINSENIIDSDNEISTVIKLGNTRNHREIKLAEADNKNLINSKNFSNTYESQKSKLLKNVRRNLMPVLEDDLMNNDKDIKKDKNKEDTLNDDQLLVPIANSTWHSTPKKTSAKGSEFDKNLQDKFDKIEQSDIKNSTNSDITEMVVPQQFEKIANTETIASKNSKEDINNILETQKEKFSKEEKNCSQLNPIKDINQEVLTDQENEVKAVGNIEKQQSSESPKKNNTKNVHSKSCKILEKQNREKELSKGKVRNSLQLNEVDKDTEINLTKRGDKNDLLNEFLHSDKKENSMESKNSCNIQKQQLSFSKKDHAKSVHLKSCDDNSKEQDEPFEKEIAGVLRSNQIDKNTEIYSINQDKMHSAKLQDSCNIQKQQVKITGSEIIDKKYTIINKQDNNISIEKNNINSHEEISKATEIENNIPLTSDTDNEEDSANDMSPENKRLQQQKRLNLVMSSDSSQSEDEYIVIETSKNHERNNDDSDTSCCNKDTFENDVTNCEKINTDISCKEAAIIPTKKKEDLPNMKKEMKNQAETALLTSCTNENNNSCVEESRINEISSRNKTGLLDKENFRDKSSQNEDRMSELGIRCKSRHEQNKESTKCSNVHLDISCHYRPYNLQQLVKDEKLLVETIPAGFTLADLSEDDEAFILNVPNKALQCNLQDQLLSLKEKTIKFGGNKYRIMSRHVGTVSCIFATGKQRRPYKTVNIKDISTITVQERLPYYSRKSNMSNLNDTVISSESESSKINDQRNETNLKMLKVECNKRKRSTETEQCTTKKRRGKLKN